VLRAKPVDTPHHSSLRPRSAYIRESKLPPFNHFTLADLDATKAACSDFAGHVNGKWLAANPIPGDRSSWGAFEMLAERSLGVQRQLAEQAAAKTGGTGVDKIVGDFWATGMDEANQCAGHRTAEAKLAKIDALADGPAVADFARSAADGRAYLIGFGAMPDFKNSDINIAATGQGGLGLPDVPYYTKPEYQKIRDAYVAYIAKALELSGVPAADAATQAKDVLAFETRLAKVSKSSEEFSRDVGLYYNPVSPADADKLSPNFPFTKLFESQGVAVPEMFSLSVPAYHAEVSKMLADVPASQWQSYLRFHLIDGAAPYLSDAFVQANYEFYGKKLRGQKELEARWKRVLGAIENGVGEAMGQKYVEVAFPAASKAQMEELVRNLGVALEARIEGLEWMSAETKAKALAKLATFAPKVGYPEKWRDYSTLATGRSSYLENVLAGIAFNRRYELSKIGKPVDKTEWGMTPQTVNAYYNPLQNEIVFPAAILQPPFFDANADAAVNYGGIGAVIGHEISHGFDDQGAQYDAKGALNNWWTPDDSAKFKTATNMLVAQYSAYCPVPAADGKPALCVKGELTLGENIADLAGLTVAYSAYQLSLGGKPAPMIDGMSGDQRFFLGWAQVWRRLYRDQEFANRLVTDPHSPSEFRVSVVRNLDAWYDAFKPAATDALFLAPDARIKIW
jgi:putative endopeptidase